ncbi:unnamed protein product [Calicophoron daubneyi]|uniref:Telomere length regulation protein TEL2 homolog n=1 Tax=Calicophoron daubneyi TaxID=300641 RepID=A0AAV2T4G0_CALDB
MSNLDEVAKGIITKLSESADPPEAIRDFVTYPLDTDKLNVTASATVICEFYRSTLYKLIGQIFLHYFKSRSWHGLIEHIVRYGKADIVFQYLCNQLSNKSLEDNQLDLIAIQLERFIFTFDRLRSVLLLSCAESTTVPNKAVFLERYARLFVNLPTLFANANQGRSDSRLLEKRSYVRTVFSSFSPEKQNSAPVFQLYGLIVSQFCLNGYATEAGEFILNSVIKCMGDKVTDSGPVFWPTVFCHLKETCLESCLQPILTSSSHPHYVCILLSEVFQQPAQMNSFIRIFRRTIFVRYFPSGKLLRNMFGSLSELITAQNSPTSTSMVNRINDELGIPVLRLWADASAIRSTSVEQQIYISFALASWITDFYLPTASVVSPQAVQTSLLPDVLTGISNHLSSPLQEIRTIGMAVGESVVRVLDIFGKPNQKSELKFDYEENDMVLQLRSFFHPMPSFESSKHEISETILLPATAIADDSSQQTSEIQEETDGLDSDDDRDPVNYCFKPLPDRPSAAKSVQSESSMGKKPRYLRECLDGMLLAKPEENQVSVACTLAAADLIYAHPQAARELATDFARVFVHVEPPASPDEAKVATARHDGLVAIGTVAPKECSRYLTNEFCQPTCSLGQRLNILSALTDIACQLSSTFKLPEPSAVQLPNTSKAVSIISDRLEQKTRRFCSKPPAKALSTNAFAPYAGEFFFPLFNSLPQVHSNSLGGVFAHQDASLLASLVACLATVYACSRFSPVQTRMAQELLDLAPLLYRHPEPAVRRAVLIATGTVITMTPPTVLSANPQLVLGGSLPGSQKSLAFTSHSDFFLPEWLSSCSSGDADSECRLLAKVGLSALIERVSELSTV